MIQFSIFPGENGLHPLIVHFPIALLLAALLFIILGAALPPQQGRPFLLSALMMFIGTASVFVAAETGEAAGRLVGEAPQTKQILEQHEELAETIKFLFSALTVTLAGLLLSPEDPGA
jgi:uncharacterized membrane protein